MAATPPVPSPVLIGFGSNYYHALGGSSTSPTSLHHSDDELEVDARIMEGPAPWNEANDTLKDVACTTSSTVFLTEQGRVYQSGTFHGRQWMSPTQIEIPYPRKCVEVAAGRHFCIGRLEQGVGVVSWGAGHFGQLGLGPHVTGLDTPQIISHLRPEALGGSSSSTTRVRQVAAGAWHALALLDNGRVMAWGSNRKYQCGIKGGAGAGGGAAKSSPPTLTYPHPMDFHGKLQKVACGRLHSVGLERDTGRVYSWGACHHGQCGQYSRNTCVVPPRLVEALQRVVVVDISAGDSHSLALTGGGRVFVWGNGMDGQLGLGGVVPVSRPKLLVDLDFVAIEAGREWKLQQLESAEQPPQPQQPLSSAAAVPCSYTGSPILGSSKSPPQVEALVVPAEAPRALQLAQVPKIVKITACGSYSTAISSSGHVYAWGYNDAGQLGLPRSSTELPLVEMTSSTMKQSSSGRLLQIRSFESNHNVMLPRRVDALAKYRITSVAAGPCHLWCIGSERPEGEEAVVGRTLYEAQEGRRRRSMLRLRKHLSSTSSIRSVPSSLTAISPIDELNPEEQSEIASEIGVLSLKDTIGSDEDGSSSTTAETEASLLSPIGSLLGEHQSPADSLDIEQMDLLQISKDTKGAEQKKGAFPELSSPFNGIPSPTEAVETEQGKAPGLLGHGSSLRRKSPKKGRPKEKYQKLGSEDPAPAQIEGNDSPPTCAVETPCNAKKEPTDKRRPTIKKSVSWLMRGKRISNPSEKQKKGRLGKAISSSFGK